MKTSLAVLALFAISLTGCAEHTDSIQASYVSPTTYQKMNCSQILTESKSVAGRLGELAGVQNKAATEDALATGVAVLLFWPAAFLAAGGPDESDEISRLKGMLDALESASDSKNCGITFKDMKTSGAN